MIKTAILKFDASSIEPTSDFEVLPIGDYKAQITKSEMKETNAGDGEYLSLTHTIIDGEYKGRLVFCNLNLRNKNAKAVEISQRNLSAICRAVGVMQPKDSSELHNKPMLIKIKIRPANAQYGESNDIAGWTAINGGNTLKKIVPKPAESTGATPPAMPWDRN